jgi:hypothetical protein
MSTDYATIKKPLRDQLFALLGDLGWHGHMELRDAGGTRYSARLLELKRLGFQIDSRSTVDLEDSGKTGKEYRLLSRVPSSPKGKRVKVFLEERDAVAACEGRVTAAARVAVDDALASFRANREKL